jgi:cyclopropane fatty-acyl-phospholipid synthase-like methyltransferase
VLRAVHRVLKPGARFCFFVIASTSALTDADREQIAQRQGNDHVEAPVPYDQLMEEAGFCDVQLVDVTPQYVETTIKWKRAWEEDAQSFIGLVGADEYSRKIRNRELDIALVEQGLVSRYQVLGTKR